MHIEEIVIDGFKSYATRTVVTGFDPFFNAITGLNGSGKSNILDSICFVLGISNLSQVRVGNLQDLVYKSGQAGVTKATVTINFNNSDKKGSPVGYEHFDQISVTRQVVIGGKNKYMINGHAVQASQVQNLFHSVQLNVNNPHFLIMQGRITKVLNMKPYEILGMIEEAAGTRMFENKKQAALKTIEKKSAKMSEISKVLQNEITPTLERLRGEKRHYLKWSTNNTEIEKLQRLCIAYAFSKANEEVSRSADELKEMENDRDRLNAELAQHKEAYAQRESEARKLQELKDKDYETALSKAKAKEEALSKELVKVNTVWKNKKASANKEEKSLEGMAQQAGDAQGAVEAKMKEIEACEASLKEAEATLAEKEKTLKDISQAYQSMCAGVAQEGAEDEGSATLTDLIASSSQAAQQAQGDAEQWKLRISHLEKSIAETKKELKKSDKEGKRVDQERATLQKAIDDLQSRIKALGCDGASTERLRAQLHEEESAIEGLKHIVDTLLAQLEGRLAFEYKDPEKNFNRARVKGLVAKLVTLKDPATATAVEVVAGAKLYQVVTDTEQTGKLLLQKGGLRKRVTIIPLNKIFHTVVDNNCMRKAQQLAISKGGQANLALELVGYDDEIRAAMEHVFGTTIVCDSLDIAKTLTFNKEISRRTVTLDGDSFDPSGTLTGGSKQSIGTILSKLQELNKATVELEEREVRFATISTTLSKQANSSKEYGKLSSAVEIKEHELRLLEERASQSVHAMHTTQIESQEEEMTQAKASLEECKSKAKEASARHKELTQQEAGLRKQREAKLKGLEKTLKTAKKAHEEANAAFKTVEQSRKMLTLELKELKGENSSVEDQLSSSRRGLDQLKDDVKALEEQMKVKRDEYEAANHVLAEAKKQLSVCDKQINKLMAENDKASKAISTTEIEAKRLENKLSRFMKDKVIARKTVQHMLEKHPWIETEKQFFGRRHTDYDFEAKNPAKCQAVLTKLQEEQQSLAKNINKKVMGMIEKVEGEYNELMEKFKVIENDKVKIQSVIEELDVKKNEALETTWVKVNRDFGSIFSTLLPGTSAKLEPTDGGSVLEGLEVKVAFGSVWKETLTELSGGQRSLLALSLILSLLLFKPAPMYILDEVDAALDLSHTQNIGAMLRTHFSHSQFIVVSLKEGMFNNANVIFRTRFVDGVSTVAKTLGNGPALNSAAAAAGSSSRQQQQGEAEAKRKRGKMTNGASATTAGGRENQQPVS